MNKLESRHAEMLEALRISGDILWWKFESVKLRLADKTWYSPDFLVFHPFKFQNIFEFQETKGGFWRDDARVKIKVAAEHFPHFAFRAFTWKTRSGECREEKFGQSAQGLPFMYHHAANESAANEPKAEPVQAEQPAPVILWKIERDNLNRVNWTWGPYKIIVGATQFVFYRGKNLLDNRETLEDAKAACERHAAGKP